MNGLTTQTGTLQAAVDKFLTRVAALSGCPSRLGLENVRGPVWGD